MPVTVELIVDVLSGLGGQAHIEAIVAGVRAVAPPPLPADVAASVRGRIQERCSAARSYKGGADLFQSVHGVMAHRGVWRLREDTLARGESTALLDSAAMPLMAFEGQLRLRIHLRRERSAALVTAFKAGLADLACWTCGFDFERFYGLSGSGYIEAHHRRPVSLMREGAETRVSDLVGLCANCHRVVHRNGLLPVEVLRRDLEGRGARWRG